MVEILKALLNRRMSLTNRRNGNGHLPRNVLDYLERKFCLHPQDMLGLRAVKRRGLLGSSPAMFIRIYDQSALGRNGFNIKHYNDLDQQNDALLFEGHILDNDAVYLNCRKIRSNLRGSPNYKRTQPYCTDSHLHHN